MPTPPPFPFRITGHVIHSARGLYGYAAFIVMLAVGIGALLYLYAERNSPTAIVWLWCFIGVLLLGAAWCTYWGRRVQLWEREYERVMGHRYGK